MRPESCPLRWHNRVVQLLTLTAVVTTPVGAPANADDRRVIVVSCDIAPEAVAAMKISPASLGAVAAACAHKVQHLAEVPFTHYRWETPASVKVTDSIGGHLALRLTPRKKAYGTLWMVRIVGEAVPRQIDMPQFNEPILYRYWDRPPRERPDELRDDLLALIGRGFANQSFQDALNRDFLGRFFAEFSGCSLVGSVFASF